MNIEIPEFLLEMAKQIREQNNCYTAEPIFEVRCKRYLPTEEGYNESHWELHGPDSEGWPIYSTKNGFDNSDAANKLYEIDGNWCDEWLADQGLIDIPDDCSPEDTLSDGVASELFCENFCFDDHRNNCELFPGDIKIFHMQEVEETIKTCLTRADCESFIARKQHDYPKLYIYATSMVFCPQMIQLRNWIMGLGVEV